MLLSPLLDFVEKRNAQLAKILCRILEDKWYLIVMDDICIVERCLVDDKNGSWIVVTSRFAEFYFFDI